MRPEWFLWVHLSIWSNIQSLPSFTVQLWLLQRPEWRQVFAALKQLFVLFTQLTYEAVASLKLRVFPLFFVFLFITENFRQVWTSSVLSLAVVLLPIETEQFHISSCLTDFVLIKRLVQFMTVSFSLIPNSCWSTNTYYIVIGVFS